jgi:hypothetical protein
MLDKLKYIARAYSQIHVPDGSPNVFLFSTPRSGSTWLMELIWSQPGFKFCDEPLNIRDPLVARTLGISDWLHLYHLDALPAIERYFRGFCAGTLKFKNPRPFSRHYRPVTRRIVFKEIHAGHDRINWFRDSFNGRIIYLVRHPIAVSLSREVYATVDALIHSDYRRNFTSEQLRFSRRILESGSKLERGVLAWCLQNAVPLRDATDDWTVVSYEQLVIEPRPVVEYLAQRLQLPDPQRMLRLLHVPSFSERKSDAETRRLLETNPSERHRLVDKWCTRVTESEERCLMEILDRFDLDVYRFGTPLPAERVWISPQVARASQ